MTLRGENSGERSADRRYRTIVADPPWPIRDLRNRQWAGKGGRRARTSSKPYEVMSLEGIWKLPVEEMAQAHAHLFLWVPNELHREGIGCRCAREWGFEPLNEIVWDKLNFGLGKFPRPQHEILLICRRGHLPFQVNNVGSVQRWSAPRAKNNGGRVHSAKPDGALDLIEQASPGPYLELFARRARFGWDYWGDQSLGTAEMPECAA